MLRLLKFIMFEYEYLFDYFELNFHLIDYIKDYFLMYFFYLIKNFLIIMNFFNFLLMGLLELCFVLICLFYQ